MELYALKAAAYAEKAAEAKVVTNQAADPRSAAEMASALAMTASVPATRRFSFFSTGFVHTQNSGPSDDASHLLGYAIPSPSLCPGRERRRPFGAEGV